MSGIEQGPIRPPSEAQSLLLRVTRNCSWNHCEFCHIYKGNKLSLRTVEEVKQDIDSIKEIVDAETSGWGVDVESIKIQEVELPAEMKTIASALSIRKSSTWIALLVYELLSAPQEKLKMRAPLVV